MQRQAFKEWREIGDNLHVFCGFYATKCGERPRSLASAESARRRHNAAAAGGVEGEDLDLSGLDGEASAGHSAIRGRLPVGDGDMASADVTQ